MNRLEYIASRQNVDPQAVYRSQVYRMDSNGLKQEIKRLKRVLMHRHISARDEERQVKDKSRAMLELSVLRDCLRRQAGVQNRGENSV